MASQVPLPGQRGQRVFTAHRHYEDGYWWADSPEAPGWTAAANSPEELFELVQEAPGAIFHWPPGYSTVLFHEGAW